MGNLPGGRPSMKLDAIKAALLASYETDGGINHLDGVNLPSQESVNEFARQCMHLLFPGYFEETRLSRPGRFAAGTHREEARGRNREMPAVLSQSPSRLARPRPDPGSARKAPRSAEGHSDGRGGGLPGRPSRAQL